MRQLTCCGPEVMSLRGVCRQSLKVRQSQASCCASLPGLDTKLENENGISFRRLKQCSSESGVCGETSGHGGSDPSQNDGP